MTSNNTRLYSRTWHRHESIHVQDGGLRSEVLMCEVLVKYFYFSWINKVFFFKGAVAERIFLFSPFRICMNHKETNTQKVTKIKHTTHRMDQIDIKLNAASNADGRVRRRKVFLQIMITKRWKDVWTFFSFQRLEDSSSVTDHVRTWPETARRSPSDLNDQWSESRRPLAPRHEEVWASARPPPPLPSPSFPESSSRDSRMGVQTEDDAWR